MSEPKTYHWHPVSEPVPAEWHSGFRRGYPILLAVPGWDTAQRGYYYGEPLNEFMIEGINREQHTTHWMPLPELPK